MRVGNLVSIRLTDDTKQIGVIVEAKAEHCKVHWTTGNRGWYRIDYLTEEICK